MPSGYYGNHAGEYSWINFCPMCKYYNTLSNNPKGTYEGEITCYHCDSDYDGTSGADKHGSGARAWLIPYVPEPVKNVTVEPVKELSPLEKAHQMYSRMEILKF